MVRAISSFLEFYYLARRDRQTNNTLEAMKCALARFHQYSQIFIDEGVRKDLNLPRQHALRHYVDLIKDFGALNGLCTSITESAHKCSVKQPWRMSNRFHALG